ncbi:tRNA (adenosine(37)-N6)-threonylcarbamoyltransferase complex ATPase subunit type 1 TsaE [Candidatus Dojkabacteria bacterium]|nr:tRNA (adenosine(37)-N6)-threonylcarbamoyltransferase complex ATPase subunit type 1 TsaE [Candidatus Dojkabacteria bacterium]
MSVSREYLVKYKEKTLEFKDYDALVSEVLKLIPECKCICLYGELGAGKTYLTGKLLATLNVKEPVVSPTFVLMNEYIASGKVFNGPVFHIDAYRLTEEEFKESISLFEFLEIGGLVIIEWADRVPNILPESRIEVQIKTD